MAKEKSDIVGLTAEKIILAIGYNNTETQFNKQIRNELFKYNYQLEIMVSNFFDCIGQYNAFLSWDNKKILIF